MRDEKWFPDETWIEKCYMCKHSYEIKSDDYLFCRLSKSGCKFQQKTPILRKREKMNIFQKSKNQKE